MTTDLINYFKDKRILILGFGREGISTYKLIRKYLKEQTLYIADQKENFQNSFDFLRQDKNVQFISGSHYLNNLESYDIIMKSPGISFAKIDTSKILTKIKSQLELLLEFYNNFTIGVTGTKGKSTTSSLIYTMLKESGKKVELLGNIGIPVFDFVDNIDEDTILVLEMSSHQLEFMKKSPNIAILLNIFPEHLDHYTGFEQYALAKCNIYKYQNENDYFLYNCDNRTLSKLVKNPISKTYRVSFAGIANSNIYLKNSNIFFEDEPIYNIHEQRNLLGDYNLNNIMFVLGVSMILSLDLKQTIKSIGEFKTLAHRLEFVGKYDDVFYYDNSIATIPMATIEAIKALKTVDTVIIGGLDRGIDYTDFIKYLNECSVKNVICMPKTGHDIAKKLDSSKTYIVETLQEAVDTAKKVTEKNKICLLSPAAASYGFFKNFEEKGDLFKKLVRGE